MCLGGCLWGPSQRWHGSHLAPSQNHFGAGGRLVPCHALAGTQRGCEMSSGFMPLQGPLRRCEQMGLCGPGGMRAAAAMPRR